MSFLHSWVLAALVALPIISFTQTLTFTSLHSSHSQILSNSSSFTYLTWSTHHCQQRFHVYFCYCTYNLACSYMTSCHVCVFLLPISKKKKFIRLFICLFETRKREKRFFCWFTPQMLAAVREGQAKTRSLELHSGFSRGWLGHECLNQLPLQH